MFLEFNTGSLLFRIVTKTIVNLTFIDHYLKNINSIAKSFFMHRRQWKTSWEMCIEVITMTVYLLSLIT